MIPDNELLRTGIAAVKQGHHAEGIKALESYCLNPASPGCKDYVQAQMWLVRAYQDSGQTSKAVLLCRRMASNGDPQVRAWAEKVLGKLGADQAAPADEMQLDPPTNRAQATTTGQGGEPSTVRSPQSVPSEEVTGTTLALSPEPEGDPHSAELSRGHAAERLTPEASDELLRKGTKFLRVQNFAEAVEALEAYVRGTDPETKDYGQAQMSLAKAYKGNDQTEPAIALGRQLLNSEKEYLRVWAKRFLLTLLPVEEIESGHAASASSDAVTPEDTPEPPTGRSPQAGTTPRNRTSKPRTTPPGQQPQSGTDDATAAAAFPKAGRAGQRGVKLSMKGVAANLAFASSITLSLLAGMVLVLSLTVLLIIDSANPTQGLLLSIAITLLFNALVFFISPWIMDLIQGWFYNTRWTDLSEIRRYSPETVRIVQEVCRQKNLKEPRLGIIPDDNPTAFTYGALPNGARLVVSRGLFKYLDDDEIATVYAHELGHIVHWDFAVMTLASTLVQICYLVYEYIGEMADRFGGDNKQIKQGARAAALTAYVFYLIGQYLVLYLSRVREYYADHFAAEVTGNPNGLSRALVKIAYGIVEEGSRTEERSKLLQGTRTLGIADSRSSGYTGAAYRVAAEPQTIGRVFLWDMFNPWAKWMELNSTHPLTGKRVRALSTYAEQLGLETEFDMGLVMREGRSLSKRRLYGNFVLDVLLFWADWLGTTLGGLVGVGLLLAGMGNWKLILGLTLMGFSIGTFLKMMAMYPDFNRAAKTDVLTLMSDPYASPLRGRAVQLSGEIIGRGEVGYIAGCDFKLQDPTGLIYLRYVSRFGPVGNFLFGFSQAESFIHQEVPTAIGWFRRGMMPWVDLVRMDCPSKWNVTSHPRFWMLLAAIGSLVAALLLPLL